MPASPDQTSATEALHTLLSRPVTASDRRKATLHVLDWLACALGARRTAPGQALLAQTVLAGDGPCIVLGAARTAAALDAAFINGGLGNVLEMDDIHRTSILHPGPIVIPAALAAAQAFDMPADRFLDAVVRGYEATIRIGRTAGQAHYAHFHATATCGVFGAATAASFLLGLDPAAVVAALGNAGATAGGLWRCRFEPGMSKQWHNAVAAQNGLRAAVAARSGLTGNRFVLEGEEGFLPVLAAGGDLSRLLSEPDGPWLIHDTSFKPWPSCRHSHPAVDAALLARESGIAPDDVITAELATYDDALLFCDRPRPVTETEAKFSLQHVVGLCLARGRPQLADFLPENLERPEVAALRARVRVARSDAITRAYPARYGASLTLHLTDGTRRAFEVRDALGDPARPVSDETLREKASGLFAWGAVDAGRHDDLVRRTLALGTVGTLADLSGALLHA
ncbi:2-methylcitrate dehydratase [Azorhizobium oxalatiphilum]|uniref:2-methylcitrate dehydratase n=1 Tax=Azorhizobium oxalatiphilum TaxID=980631 RepID=A0A917BUC8_9HYPH|nr:MmgE/PrpD family protein [Azorhizobium oxalatiphilum]GGF59157.1 2-methylcitrate dehydratase [Azorhizobium oxalatiphilum]